MWPWGRGGRKREQALRDAAAGFYEVEVSLRRITFLRDEVQRLIDERIGLNRAQCQQLVAGTEAVLTRHNTFYADYFTDLDAWTPLARHDTAARLDDAATVFWGWSGTWDGILDSHRDGRTSAPNSSTPSRGSAPSAGRSSPTPRSRRRRPGATSTAWPTTASAAARSGVPCARWRASWTACPTAAPRSRDGATSRRAGAGRTRRPTTYGAGCAPSDPGSRR